jgi:hypothetical protein
MTGMTVGSFIGPGFDARIDTGAATLGTVALNKVVGVDVVVWCGPVDLDIGRGDKVGCRTGILNPSDLLALEPRSPTYVV